MDKKRIMNMMIIKILRLYWYAFELMRQVDGKHVAVFVDTVALVSVGIVDQISKAYARFRVVVLART